MTNKKPEKKVNAKEEFLNALRPIGKKTMLTRNLIKVLEKKQTKMPSGKNSNTEKFILGLSVSYCLFNKNKAALLKHGDPLKQYTKNYAERVPATQADLVTEKFNELLSKNKKGR